jgi:LmbE family N-acetylglucosaminyl deacetylase
MSDGRRRRDSPSGDHDSVRVAVVSESFLPAVNGVTNSVLRVLEHFQRHGHQALVIAPGRGPERYAGAEVVRVRSLPLPRYRSFPVGLPSPRIEPILRAFAPDVVHLASPFALGALGALAARRLGVPAVAVYQTDVAGFLSSYHLGVASPAAWRWLARLHGRAALTLARLERRRRARRRAGSARLRAGLHRRGGLLYGHPDHVRAHRATLLAVEASAAAGLYTEAGPPWRVRKLYQATVPRSLLAAGLRELASRGLLDRAGLAEPGETGAEPGETGAEPGETGAESALPPLGTPDELITTVVDVRPWLERKWAALQAHASQLGPGSLYQALPEDLRALVLGTEWFIGRALVDTGTPSGEHDLLDGIRD